LNLRPFWRTWMQPDGGPMTVAAKKSRCHAYVTDLFSPSTTFADSDCPLRPRLCICCSRAAIKYPGGDHKLAYHKILACVFCRAISVLLRQHPVLSGPLESQHLRQNAQGCAEEVLRDYTRHVAAVSFHDRIAPSRVIAPSLEWCPPRCRNPDGMGAYLCQRVVLYLQFTSLSPTTQ